MKVGHRRMYEPDVVELVERIGNRTLPWRDRRKVFVETVAARLELPSGLVSDAANAVWPRMTAKQAMAKLRSRATLEELGADPDFIEAWMASDRKVGDGALADEVRARFEGVPARYAHVIVDEAQDLTLFQLRAMMRRAEGVTLVGDDAQRRRASGIGLRRAAQLLDTGLESMATAYRMSAEIADWLNDWARRNAIDAVELVGIRPTGVDVGEATDVAVAEARLRERWANVAVIRADDVWVHKGIEYDGVVLATEGMSAAEVYLGASRAAHELVVI
jgi:DNA helicase IV